MKISASIVIFNSPKKVIKTVVTCVSDSIINKIYILDNSSTDCKKEFIQSLSKKIIYIQGHGNIGYGAAHNMAIREAIRQNVKYHLVLNPDIIFSDDVIEKLAVFMDEKMDVGLVMPEVLYPNGEPQYLCKLLPTPADLFFRRFLFWGRQRINKKYEFKNLDNSRIYYNIPSLSGCFMMLRVDVLIRTGGFDERFFMYMEDVDLCRRIHGVAQTAFFPFVNITHHYEKGSYKNFRLLIYHILSAFKYFNKWGWFFDKERKIMNKQILDEIMLRR